MIRRTALDQLTDDLTVHVLRRADALRFLQTIDLDQVPPEAAAQIRLACDALVRGGEVATT